MKYLKFFASHPPGPVIPLRSMIVSQFEGEYPALRD